MSRDSQRRIRAEITSIADALCSKIKSEGSKAASSIAPGITEEEAKSNVEDAQRQAERDIAEYENQICDRLAEICEETGNELSLIDKSAFAVNVQVNLENKIPQNVPSDELSLGKLSKQTSSLTSSLTDFARTSSQAAKHSIFGMNSAELVKNIGHFFGFKFAPWGAVNFVKYLGWIGAALTIFSVIADIVGGDDERKKMEEDLRKAREEIQNNFDTVAENIRAEFIERSENKIDELTAPVLANADEKLAEFQNKKNRLQSLGHELARILGEVNGLMGEVQQTAQA